MVRCNCLHRKVAIGLMDANGSKVPESRHGVSAANPACEVSNIAIVDGEPPKREENDHETLRWN